MSRNVIFALATFAAVLFVASGAAWSNDLLLNVQEETTAEADNRRFVLEKTESGFVRLDTRTGAISICREESGKLVCKLGADERGAFHDNTDRLTGEIDRLNNRVMALENSLVEDRTGRQPDSKDRKPESFSGNKLTSKEEREVDRAVRLAERFLRGFVGIVKDLKRDLDPT